MLPWQLFSIKRASDSAISLLTGAGSFLSILPRRSGGRVPCKLPVTFLGPRPKLRSSGRAQMGKEGGPVCRWGRTTFVFVFPALFFRRCPTSSCHSSSLGQGDPVRLRNDSAKLGYLDGNVILSFLRGECEKISVEKWAERCG